MSQASCLSVQNAREGAVFGLDHPKGQELLKFYESSPGEHKGFCSNCGSSLYTKFDAVPDIYGFPLGTLDTDPDVKAGRHVFVGSKAPWFEITDDLPQNEEYD